MSKRDCVARKVIGWNINQRSGLGKEIPGLVSEELVAQSADIIVLTEVVKNGNLSSFIAKMQSNGYDSAISLNENTNEVCILWKKDLYQMIVVDDSLITAKENDNPNYLRVELKDQDDIRFNVVGYRIRVGNKKSKGEYEFRARQMRIVVNKLSELTGPTMVVTDSNNLRRGAKTEEWNLSVIDSMLAEVGYERNTPEGSSIFEANPALEEYEFAEDHIITKGISISDIEYDREFVQRDTEIYMWGKDFCKHIEGTSYYKQIRVGYPDHAIVKGYFEVADDLSSRSIVDCIYDVGETVDLKSFLNAWRNPYPAYYIAESICNEIPKDSIKYKDIKKYIDGKLGMKRGCRYDVVVRIIWAAIRYTYPENMGWEELSLEFKKPVERPFVTIDTNDSIESNIESVKAQVEAYFYIHKNVSLDEKEYIRANIDECETVEQIRNLIGFLFSLIVKSDIDDRKWKERQMFMKNAENVIAKVTKKDLNKMDCTFYFLIRENDKTVVLKDVVMKAFCERICQDFEPLVDVKYYAMRSGSGVRSSLMLKDEWSDIIPEKIGIVLVDMETEIATLLSLPQRNMFFDMVMKSTEDLDTVSIAEYVLNEIDADTEDL